MSDKQEILSMSMQEELLHARQLADRFRAREAECKALEIDNDALRKQNESLKAQLDAEKAVLRDLLSAATVLLDGRGIPQGSDGTPGSAARLLDRLGSWQLGSARSEQEIGPASNEEILAEACSIADRWTYPDRVHFEQQDPKNWLLVVSTGGWSDNEEIIANTTTMFNAICWIASLRGGKHAFGRGSLADEFWNETLHARDLARALREGCQRDNAVERVVDAIAAPVNSKPDSGEQMGPIGSSGSFGETTGDDVPRRAAKGTPQTVPTSVAAAGEEAPQHAESILPGSLDVPDDYSIIREGNEVAGYGWLGYYKTTQICRLPSRAEVLACCLRHHEGLPYSALEVGRWYWVMLREDPDFPDDLPDQTWPTNEWVAVQWNPTDRDFPLRVVGNAYGTSIVAKWGPELPSPPKVLP